VSSEKQVILILNQKEIQMNNLFSLDGKVAVVTGANGLLGTAHCKSLLEFGANVVMIDISYPDLLCFDDLYKDKILMLNCDITNKDSLLNAKELILSKFGKIDILVNNAAINDMVENPKNALEESKFENYPVELFRKTLDVNVTGTFLCSQVFGSVMADCGKGSIINIGSTYGLTAPNQSLYKDEKGNQTFFKSAAYPTSKGAIIMFTKFLAAYWGNSGVRVNTLSPGGVENNQPLNFINKYSEMTPLGRMSGLDDYTGALIFLASDASNYVTGANLSVDGGWTCW
jgi:NAD(P)-dependent dehydrogenase (short-subunit alcohol dehydrogenase family)